MVKHTQTIRRQQPKNCLLDHFVVLALTGSTHFMLMFHFHTPYKREKTSAFLTFSGGIEREYWLHMGLVSTNKTSKNWYRHNYKIVQQQHANWSQRKPHQSSLTTRKWKCIMKNQKKKNHVKVNVFYYKNISQAITI